MTEIQSSIARLQRAEDLASLLEAADEGIRRVGNFLPKAKLTLQLGIEGKLGREAERLDVGGAEAALQKAAEDKLAIGG